MVPLGLRLERFYTFALLPLKSLFKNKFLILGSLNVFLICQSSEAARKATPSPEPEPSFMTNFLTEADLNRAFIKIVAVIAVPVGLQIWAAWKDSKSDIKGRLDRLDENYLELLKIVSRLEGKFDERKR